MNNPKGHPSDSAAQRGAEAEVLTQLSGQIGFTVLGNRLDLGGDCSVMVDGINREHRFICEVYSRVGKLQAAQVEKVASDILKLTFIEQRLGGSWRKAVCFVDEMAADTLRNRSWLAAAAKAAGIEVVVVDLSPQTREAVLKAQALQVMVNKPSIDG
jgi:hypothetical protein